MRLLIVGAGYVGITIGVVLSETHHVTLLDVDKSRVDMINQGICPIHEEGLPDLLKSAVSNEKMRAILPNNSIGQQDVILICVGTPSNTDGSVNLSYIMNSIDLIFQKINELLSDYMIIGIKSTVPPGTTRTLILNRISELGINPGSIGVIFNPEFLREGRALYDAQKPDRIVIGAADKKAADIVQKMYETSLTHQTKFVKMSIESAELCKYVSNSFLATKISFANEMANIVENVSNADIEEIMLGVGLDSRIAPSFLASGAGYGGSCFPKDIDGLIHIAENDYKIEVPILRAIKSVNSFRPDKLVNMLLKANQNISGKKIAVLGLAYKPGTDDTRESPSLKVIKLLLDLNAEVWVHDPLALKMKLNSEFSSMIKISDNLEACLKDACACILVTAWNIYEQTGLDTLTKFMKDKIFIDGRRIFSRSEIPDNLIYYTIGRKWQ